MHGKVGFIYFRDSNREKKAMARKQGRGSWTYGNIVDGLHGGLWHIVAKEGLVLLDDARMHNRVRGAREEPHAEHTQERAVEL